MGRPKREDDPVQDSLIDNEGGIYKTSVILTKKLMDQIREVQSRQGIYNFSHFCRVFFRKHLPEYLQTARKIEETLEISLDETLQEVFRETARHLGLSEEDLARQMIMDCMSAWVQKAEERLKALRGLKERIDEANQS